MEEVLTDYMYVMVTVNCKFDIIFLNIHPSKHGNS